MKSTPINLDRDFAPIPFTDQLCEASLELKSNGLPWEPHVGCFVWDPEEVIQEPSPFPHRIYFILNLGHFIRRFGSIQSLKEKAIWLPTSYQCKQLEVAHPKLNFEPIKNCY